ncbi:MAG: DUF3426 domain-containing protein, partial [Thermodesulfobacteriota bacterium]|nr:DUF3426 domain-containing protein [Thermodesulfobacteriota bacterium]
PEIQPEIQPEAEHLTAGEEDNDAFSFSSDNSFSFDQEESEEESSSIQEQQSIPQEHADQDFSFESIPIEPTVETPDRAAEPIPSEAVTPDEDTAQTPVPKPPRQKRKTSKLMMFLLLIILVIAGGYGYLFVTTGTTDIMKMIQSVQQQLSTAPQQPQGEIRIGKTESYYVDNPQTGQLFVIQGRASNGYPSAQSELSVIGTLYKQGGESIVNLTAYCGNIISKEELKSATMATITTQMDNPFGASLSNVNIAPGQSLPFMLVFDNLPAELNEFSVEAASSKAASN